MSADVLPSPERELLPTADRRRTTRLVWQLVRTHRAPLIAAILAFAVAGLSALAAPWMLGRIADLVLEGGSIVEQGTHAELLAHGRLYPELWAADAREETLR